MSVGELFGRIGAFFAHSWASVQSIIARVTGWLDREQQRRPATALPVAVLRKYSDDRGGRLAGQISYAAFLSVFPLFLVLFTVLGVVLAGHTNLQNDIANSALQQFPLFGSDIKGLQNNVSQLTQSNQLAMAIGLLWLFYGATRLSRASQLMMARVWGVDRDDLPDLIHWLPRAAAFLLVLGAGFIVGGALAGVGQFGGLGSYSSLVGFVCSLGVNVVMYRVAFDVLIELPTKINRLWPGAIFGGVAWTILLNLGALLINHQLRHLQSLYGTFATVLGLVWWMALGAMITVYAAEFNCVITRRLWPRSFRRVPAPEDEPPGDRPAEAPRQDGQG